MKLTRPIFRLKRDARILSRAQNIPLHTALDHVAAREGYGNWSLLAARHANISPAEAIYPRLDPGDMLLIAARPRCGKTMTGLALAVEANKAGRCSAFFTLEYAEESVVERMRRIGAPDGFERWFDCDCSDDICADHIAARLNAAAEETLVVIDYLQLLDQKREHPPLEEQVRTLKAFALRKRLVLVFLSQVHRSYDAATRPCPDLDDVRLPNPLDLSLFDKACFLHGGEIRFAKAGSGG